MRLSVNGRTYELVEGAALTALVVEVTADPRGVAVAVNGSVVCASEWRTTFLSEGDVVEVVTAHQGG